MFTTPFLNHKQFGYLPHPLKRLFELEITSITTGCSLAQLETPHHDALSVVVQFGGVLKVQHHLVLRHACFAGQPLGRELLKRYRNEGASGLVSRRRGRPSNNQLAPGVAQRALRLIRDRYPDFGPTLACEKLAERHGLTLGLETVRTLMTQAGLWVPRKQRAAQIHQPRNRRSCVGELIQIDGSDHRWFEDRNSACTLLVFIDDATSRLMQLHFVPTESAFAYFEATRTYLEQHGKPVAFYSDKATIFRVARESTDYGRGTTQFARVLFELNIDILCCWRRPKLSRRPHVRVSLSGYPLVHGNIVFGDSDTPAR